MNKSPNNLNHRRILNHLSKTVASLFLLCNLRKINNISFIILAAHIYIPQHFLYFLPLPQGQGSFLPMSLKAA